MLQNSYQTEAEIPDNLRGAYIAKNGRYELDKLGDDVPVVATKLSLEAENRTLKPQIAALQEKLTIAETKVLADGSVAVTPEIKTLGESLLSSGLKPADIAALQTRAETAEKTLGEIDFARVVETAAAAINRNAKGVETLLKANGLTLEEKEETVDGKPIKKYFAVSGADKERESFALDAYVTEHGSFIAPVKIEEKPGVSYFGQTPGAEQPGMTTRELVAAQLKRNYTPRTADQTAI